MRCLAAFPSRRRWLAASPAGGAAWSAGAWRPYSMAGTCCCRPQPGRGPGNDIVGSAAMYNLTGPSQAVKLFTAGQPRVGNAAFATMVEELIVDRARAVSNSDVGGCTVAVAVQL